MSLNQPLLLSSALVHQVLLSPTTYSYKQVTTRAFIGTNPRKGALFWINERVGLLSPVENQFLPEIPAFRCKPGPNDRLALGCSNRFCEIFDEFALYPENV